MRESLILCIPHCGTTLDSRLEIFISDIQWFLSTTSTSTPLNSILVDEIERLQKWNGSSQAHKPTVLFLYRLRPEKSCAPKWKLDFGF